MSRTLAVLTLLIIPFLPAPLASQGVPVFRVDTVSIGGDGGTDYLTTDPATNRVFVSRSTHVMVLDGTTGRIVGDIPDTPRVHGIALVPSAHRGFTTNGGDSTVTIFDLATLAQVGRIRIPTGGLDGIMYDVSRHQVVLTSHSRPKGTAVFLDPDAGTIVGTTELEDDAPEGAASDGRGRVFVNNEGAGTMQVIEAGSFTPTASWTLAPCAEPTGIAFDSVNQRVFAGCSDTSVVVDARTGKVIAAIPNGDGVDALGWDPGERLIYLPSGRDGTVTIVRQDDADHYRVIATVTTYPGAKTIAVNPSTHTAYLFQPQYGPAPAAPPGARPTRGPVIGAWFLMIRHDGSVHPDLRPTPTSQGSIVRPAPASIRWYHVGAVMGGIAALTLIDRDVQRSSQNSRTAGKDDIAKVFRHVGQPEVYLPVALGTIGVGLVSGNDNVLRAGGRIAASLAASGAVANFLKLAVGRTRPSYTTDPYKFKPFTRAASWPSGHTATAFSLASSVSDEIHSLPVSIGLYGIASMTAWSRVNDNRHWVSDVAAGALIGIASSKIMNGHWKVFGVGGPHILLTPHQAGVSIPIR